MIYLNENETYIIKSLDDLVNCPVNMMQDAVKHIQHIFLKRIELMEERDKGIDFKNVYLELKNDGIDETNFKMTEIAPQLTTNKSTDNIKSMGEL